MVPLVLLLWVNYPYMMSSIEDHHPTQLLVNIDYMSNQTTPTVDTLSISTHETIYIDKTRHTQTHQSMQTRSLIICLVVYRFNMYIYLLDFSSETHG